MDRSFSGQWLCSELGSEDSFRRQPMQLPPFEVTRGAVGCSTLERLPKDRTWCRHEPCGRHTSSTLIPPRQDCTCRSRKSSIDRRSGGLQLGSEAERFLQRLSLSCTGEGCFPRRTKGVFTHLPAG